MRMTKMPTTVKVRKDLGNLLKYTEELISFNEKIIYDLAREAYPHFHEYEVSKLEGVTVSADNDTWIKLKRLRETQPPTPDMMFEGWFDFGKHPSPDVKPKFLTERLFNLAIEEISDLMEAGIVKTLDDVLVPVKPDVTGSKMDVILRTTNMPEFAAYWENYINGAWQDWAIVERPRRQAINFYNKIYQIYQRVISMGEDTPIEVVFGLGVARWRVGTQKIDIPIIEQLVEIELEENGDLKIRPRNLPPQFVLKAFHALEVQGSKNVQLDIGAQFDRILEDPDRGFSPFEKSSFENILRACSARLSETGVYHRDTVTDPNDPSLAVIDDTLRISDTWVLYVRKRNDDFRRDDINKLIHAIEKSESDEELPAPAVQFVTEPSNELTFQVGQDGFDLGSTDLILPETPSGYQGGSEGSYGTTRASNAETSPKLLGQTYFFPLPFNDEQIQIVARLEDKNVSGVLVQGPPGTGKTHTIANIICHYLATKRRVLVTARTSEALTALQEKLPEGVRDLAIAVIHNDREGNRQLEHAVRILADEAKAINPKATFEQIQEKQHRIQELKNIAKEAELELFKFAQRNLAPVNYRGEEFLPMALAKIVSEERELYSWLDDDLSFDSKFDPKFDSSVIEEVLRIRDKHKNDLDYTPNSLPARSSLPDLASLIAAHSDLARMTEIDDISSVGNIPFMSVDFDNALEIGKYSRDWLFKFEKIARELDNHFWIFDIYKVKVGSKHLDEITLKALNESIDQWISLYEESSAYSLRSIICGSEADEAFDRAIEELAEGRKPFGLFSFLKSGLKMKLDQVQIEGRSPSGTQEWSVIRSYRRWQNKVTVFSGKWVGISRVIEAPILSKQWEVLELEFLKLGRLLFEVSRFWREADAQLENLKQLFPYGFDIDRSIKYGQVQEIYEALDKNIEKSALFGARSIQPKLLTLVDGFNLPFHTAVRDLASVLGNREVSQNEVAEAWKSILEEASRLTDVLIDLERMDKLIKVIELSGAPKWAKRLRGMTGSAEDRPSDYATWHLAWEWRRADGHIKGLGAKEAVRLLSERKLNAELEQKRLFAEVVRLRTFLGLKLSLTQKIEAALAKFTTAIARLGKGTGKTATRQRRIIREAAMDTAQGVPCWILPEWRVAEQLPAELGAFDLVIIDEASQSDITCISAIMRGKKVLIVGDDKQVSPSAIGVEDRRFIQLRTTYLAGIPYADQMDLNTSLYELGGMVFPGRAIMLREHFRCVEPIIRFSSRFYPTPLVPLRLPKASERLDPPLVDIYVPHGTRDGDINTAEAEVIVNEIKRMVEDPKFSARTMGVISLIGSNQAKLIYESLIRELGTDVVERHKIMCGNSATFQGQERDIILLSMVACPGNAMTQADRRWEQRFNVAASRARDRLILVRSVTSSDLKIGDLKGALIEHFRNPMESTNIVNRDVLDLCDSEFEKDFGKIFLNMGYRLRAQVPVGFYRIDFVIEGADDRRIAIELDGDKYHGPEKWADDVRRQKALEQLGWVFWRCWGSAWMGDKDGCIRDLLSQLSEMGIEPIGSVGMEGNYTSHIEIELPQPQGPMDEAEEVLSDAFLLSSADGSLLVDQTGEGL